MPKELFEVKAFESGIYYNPDDRDMPDDAAVYSENIDPYGQEGSLRAIHADATPIIAGVKATRMATINDDGTHRMVFVDDSDGDIMKVDDVHGSPALDSLEDGSFITSGEIPALQVNNKEVHMGLGKTRDPKWVGIIPHGHFGAAAPSGLQIEDAELKKPSPFPLMHKVITDSSNTYVYGIQENGNYVYKLEVSTGKLIKRSKHFFTATRAMCLSSDGNLWVVDNVSSTLHLIKIDTEDMDIFIDVVFTGIAVTMTDIIENGSYIWFAIGKSDNTGQDSNWLFNKLKSAFINAAGSQALTNKTPYKGSNHTNGTTVADGTWRWEGESAAANDDQISVTYVVPNICLFNGIGSTEWVGIVARIAVVNDQWSSTPDEGKPEFYASSGTTPAVGSYAAVSGHITNVDKGWILLIIKDNYTAGAVLDGTSAKVHAFNSDVDTSLSLGAFAHSVNQNTETSYLTVAFQHSTAAYTKFWVHTKVGVNGNGALLNSEQSSYSQANLHIDNAQISADGSEWNIFSKEDVEQWAKKSGTSDATAFKQSQVNFTNFALSGVTSAGTGHEKQFYAVSFLYDGYQESPLSPWSMYDPANTQQITFTLRIYASGLSKRITHVNIYRSNGTGDSVPTGFFRLVDSISTKYGWSETAQSHTSPNWGNYYEKDFIDNRDDGSSYEARVGISEAIDNTLPKYGLSAKVNNYLYIADCSHIDIDNATNYLFKSRPFNFDQFNWARDSLLLPSKPTALESFNGRLYAFTENKIYVINPDGMYIEDTVDGVGCIHQNLVKATDIGMCFMDKNSVYLHDGNQIRDVGARIKSHYQDTYGRQEYTSLESIGKFPSAGGSSANTLGYTGERVMSYDPHRKAFYIHFTTKIGISGTYYYLNFTNVYTVPKDRWDIWMRTHASATTSELTVYGSTNGKNGEVFTSDNESGLIQPFDPYSSTRVDTFTWYSKKFTMGDSTVDKKWFEVAALSEDGTPAILVNITENNEIFGSLTSGSKSRDIQVQLSESSDAVSSFNAFRIVYRKLRRVKAMS